MTDVYDEIFSRHSDNNNNNNKIKFPRVIPSSLIKKKLNIYRIFQLAAGRDFSSFRISVMAEMYKSNIVKNPSGNGSYTQIIESASDPVLYNTVVVTEKKSISFFKKMLYM